MTVLWRLPTWSVEIEDTAHPRIATSTGAETTPLRGVAHAAVDPDVALGRFRVVGDLGAGGMGEVVLAEDTVLGRQVALKRLRAGLAADPRQRARLRSEARIAAKLDHRAIVRVLDLVSEREVDHIVMEYVAGPSLRALRARGALPIARIVQIACEVVDALDHVHAHGVIHRDLKLENVLTARNGQPKLNDFGIARCADHEDDTASGEVMGTPRAMSPEQIGGAQVDRRSDLFSLGVMLYELVAGVSPFAAETHAHTLHRVIHHQPSSLTAIVPGVPAALSELVDHLLDKNPMLRPQSAREVLVRLRAVALPPAAQRT
jgi:eukaryotic-like serine/threonine-protein kinase